MTNPSPRGRALPAPSRKSGRFWVVVLAAMLAVGAALSAQAQSAGDPPSRAARLSDVVGQVWLYNTDSDEWITVERNRPLTTGDRVATDNGARAEITLGSTTLRLDAGTELEITRLDDSRYSVRLRGGSVAARLRNPQSLAEFEMVTDEGRFRIQTVGRYRFDRFDQTSDVTVFNGQAIYEARDSALPVTTGQHAQFWIDASGTPQYAMVAPVRDGFASWNDERDRADNRPVAATRYVSPEMTGAEDLERHGEWQQSPEYGALWVPRSVSTDWAPYTTGHWAWVRPWGWTWVDDAPWGFAPFHYGRWVYHRSAWCWAPGTYVARPVYAPALVAWIGGPRANVSVSIGGGAPVGWFPLAPREVYVPSYRSSARYQRDVNYTHVTNVTHITTIINNRNGEADRRDFANRKFAHAVTFVPAEVMTRRQHVGQAAARFRNDPQARALVAQAQAAPVLTAPPVTSPPVAPRSPQGRPAPRPPFEGRAPGFAGRPDGARPEAGRPDARPDGARPEARPDFARPGGGRPDGARGNGPRGDGPRGDGPRADGPRGDGPRGDGPRGDGPRGDGPRGDGPRGDGPRGDGSPRADGRGEARGDAGRRDDRPEVGRPGERPVAPAVAPRVTPQAPPAAITPSAAPQAVAPPAPAPNPPVGARGVLVEPSTGQPVFRGIPRGERGLNEQTAPQRVDPSGPAQRSGPPGDPAGARGLPGREMRAPVDGAGEGRGGRSMDGPRSTDGSRSPYGAAREAAPGQIPQGAIPQGTMPQRTFPPRTIDAPRAAEAPRPVDAQRPPPAGRAPEAAAVAPRPAAVAPPPPQAVAPPPQSVAPRPAVVAPPPAVQRAPEARPAEAQRPPGEGRMNRPEAPRGRGEERREEKAERQR